MSTQESRPQPWSWWCIALWGLSVALACGLYGPRFVRSLQPDADQPVDFLQEWVSARYYLDGDPVYAPQEPALFPYLGIHREQLDAFLELNAHPPTSVLVTLPFGLLSYPRACLAWNLLSLAALAAALAVIARQLRLSLSPWIVLPAVFLLLVSDPLWGQLYHGQYNLVILAMIAGAWAAERSGRPRLAGALLGTAAMLKLFPAFLVLPYLVRRRWSLVATAAGAAMAWTAVTLLVLGPHAYIDYVSTVLPHLSRYHVAPHNISLTGFWNKLFAAAQFALGPVGNNPAVARLSIAVSCLAVVALVVWVSVRARTRGEFDRAFALAVTAMLLLSPISWYHAFLLLLLPAAVVWQALPPTGYWRAAYWGSLGVLFLPHADLWKLLFARVQMGSLQHQTDGRFHALVTLLVAHCAMFGFFAVVAWLGWRSAVATGSASTSPADLAPLS